MADQNSSTSSMIYACQNCEWTGNAYEGRQHVQLTQHLLKVNRIAHGGCFDCKTTSQCILTSIVGSVQEGSIAVCKDCQNKREGLYGDDNS